MSAAQRLLGALASPDRADGPLPRTLLVGAHPDDETVGAGSRLALLRAAAFVCVTDGAPRSGEDAARHGLSVGEYAQRRRGELEAALAVCGIAPEQLTMLGCPDQQASLELAPLARRLADLIVDTRAEVIVTHPYEGGHPDHDATAFIAHAAAALAAGRGADAEIVEWTSYHRTREGALTNEFLPDPAVDDQTVAVRLTPAEIERKAAVLACHATQGETLAHLPLDVERFRPAPRYDFARPPHDWTLHYERYPWGMSGERFRELAGLALAQLGLGAPL